MNILHICSPHLSDVATLPWEIQQSFLNIITHIGYFRFTTGTFQSHQCQPTTGSSEPPTSERMQQTFNQMKKVLQFAS